MGVITTKKSLVQLEKLSTASFCRRRLAVVMVRLKMSETLREAATFIEQVRKTAVKSKALRSHLCDYLPCSFNESRWRCRSIVMQQHQVARCGACYGVRCISNIYKHCGAD